MIAASAITAPAEHAHVEWTRSAALAHRQDMIGGEVLSGPAHATPRLLADGLMPCVCWLAEKGDGR